MSVLGHPRQEAPSDRRPAKEAKAECWPRLLSGTELIGQATGSGLRKAPYLVRRRDGQIVQLSRLLFELASCMNGASVTTIADRAGAVLDLRITPEQVAYVAETKLAPLGLVPHQDGTVPTLRAATALLALRYRVGVVGAPAVNALARLLGPLFLPPILIGALIGLVACDVWLGGSGGLSAGLQTVIDRPGLALGLFGVTLLSLLFHEFGHAAACRYGGARPGRIGVGIYLVWPVFFTDVTDSYRLPKAGRLRTDLGGVYFNVLVTLAAAGAYLASGYSPLLTVVATQQVLIIDQFIPWVRLDGYHIVSDLIGVSDLFARIKPVTTSLFPRRQPDRRVTELKPWARIAVTVWVVTTVVALSGMAVLVVSNASGYLVQYWQTLILQLQIIGDGARAGSAVDVLSGVVGVLMVLLPIAGTTLLYLLVCRGAGRLLALHSARTDLTLTASPESFAVRPRPGQRLVGMSTGSDQ
jgi:putative peptide zinc metalloprotease protein